MPGAFGGPFGAIAQARGAMVRGRMEGEAAARARLLEQFALERAHQQEQRQREVQDRDYQFRVERAAVEDQDRVYDRMLDAAKPAPARNIDPLSPEGIAARAALERALSGIPTRAQRDTDGDGMPGGTKKKPKPLTVRQQQGRAFLSEPLAPEVKARAEQLWQQYRRALPTADPGDVATQVKATLEAEARAAQSAGRGRRGARTSVGATVGAGPATAAGAAAARETPRAALAPVGGLGDVNLQAADLWEELVARGMSPDAATAEVERRMGGR